jgi:hypothetical protein
MGERGGRVVLLALALGALLLTCEPAPARAGWFDFVGTAATAISDATWKVALIQAIERTLPTLLLGLCIVGVLVCAVLVARVTTGFGETARAAMRDDRVTGAEGVVLVAQGVVTAWVVVAVSWFGVLLWRAAASGLGELMR